MSIKFKLTELIKNSLQKLNIETDNIIIEKPSKKENGDYSSNIALTLTKISFRNSKYDKRKYRI